MCYTLRFGRTAGRTRPRERKHPAQYIFYIYILYNGQTQKPNFKKTSKKTQNKNLPQAKNFRKKKKNFRKKKKKNQTPNEGRCRQQQRQQQQPQEAAQERELARQRRDARERRRTRDYLSKLSRAPGWW